MKKLTDGRWTPSDGNTSHGTLGPGELKEQEIKKKASTDAEVFCVFSSPDPKGHVRYWCPSSVR